MFGKKKLLGAALAAALGLGSSAAFAAPYLPVNPAPCPATDCVQLMEDQDWETLFRPNPTGGGYSLIAIGPGTTIQPGDLFGGVLQIQATELAPPEGNNLTNLQGNAPTFTSIFLVQALTVTSAGGAVGALDGFIDTLTFGAAGDAAWSAIYGAGGLIDISAAFNVNNINGTGSNPANGTTAFFFNGDVFNTQDPTGTLSASAGSFVDGGVLQYEFGFTGAQGATEFWETRGEDAALPFFSGTTTPDNKLSQNITRQWAGPELEPHNYRFTASGDARFTGPAQIQGIGEVTGLATGTPWGVKTDTDLYIRAVPEPGTLALLAAGLLGLGAAARRRRA